MDTTPAPQPVVLTERQSRVLWLLSTGRTREDIWRMPGETRSSVDHACTRIFCLLGASTAPHAVRNGLLAGHIGPYEDCGTLAAYRRHVKRDEPVCPCCKRGSRERAETEAALKNRRPQLNEAQVRLLRAFVKGRTRSQIAAAWRLSEETVKHLTTATYTALGVAHLPQSVRREAALRQARRHNLLGVQLPDQSRPSGKRIALSDTQVSILLELEKESTLAQTAAKLGMPYGSCASRLSEAYRRLDVAWMDKGTRLPAALRRARALGLLPEPATT